MTAGRARRCGILWLTMVVLGSCGCGGRGASAGPAAGGGAPGPSESATPPGAETGAGAGSGAGSAASTEEAGEPTWETAQESRREEALAAVQALRANPPPAIVGDVWQHVADADGGEAADGVDVLLLFEPGGTALLLISSATEGLGREGEWAWDGAKLTLRFHDEDFQVDATFALDRTADEVTMPFHVFSAAAESSRWRRVALDPLVGAKDVFNAVLFAKETPVAEAVRRAADWANAQIVLVPSGRPAAEPTEPPAEPTEEPPPPTPPLQAVSADDDGVEVFYDHGPRAKLVLVTWVTAPAPPPLVPGPLAGDPRAHLPGEPPHAGPDDPPRKTALFIAPFFSQRNPAPMAKSLEDMAFGDRMLNNWDGVIKSGSTGFEFDDAETKLREAGYSVRRLFDDEASLAKVVMALGADSGEAPGLLVINTHGMKDGQLALGVYLGSDEDEAWKGWWSQMGQLAHFHQDLITFQGGTPQEPKTLAWMIHPVDYGGLGEVRYFLSVTPAFWEWLASVGAKLDRSLVYIAACLTDETPDLRFAIAARAYFAFSVQAEVEVAAAVFNYMIAALARPTWTAEEVYYNILRVVATGEMIYQEDTLLNGRLSPEASAQRAILRFVFRGYGSRNGSVLPYNGVGWLNDRLVDPGHIFWLLLSARAITSREEAFQKLEQCWTDVWSQGWAPALADPGCTLMTMGAGPNEDEVAYAQYLLAGRTSLTYSSALLPRWTLNDAW